MLISSGRGFSYGCSCQTSECVYIYINIMHVPWRCLFRLSVHSEYTASKFVNFAGVNRSCSKMSKTVPNVDLGNGYTIPGLGYGTYLVRFLFLLLIYINNELLTESIDLDSEQAKQGQGVDLVKKAIDAGYRHIDTAFLYENEVEVGEAIRAKIADGVIKREDVFVTSKVGERY